MTKLKKNIHNEKFKKLPPQYFSCFIWTIPSLAANELATLDVPVYVLDALNTMTATTSLVSSTPIDTIASNNVATILINATTPSFTQPFIDVKPTPIVPIIIQKINPTITENYIVVELESIVNQHIDFQIINSLGTIVLSEKLTLEKGTNQLNFNVENLPKGMYFIQTSVGKGRHVPMKFVKY